LSRSSLSCSSPLTGIVQDLDIFRIKPAEKLLRSAHGLEQLANSIKQKGLLQPILVRTKETHFEIVAGNRRYHSCKALGWKKIACHVVELDDREAFEISLVENLQRKTLSPLEEAQAFKLYVSDYGWGGVSSLGAKIGKSASYVTKRIKLLDLPSDMLESIKNSTISVSVAQEITSIQDQSKRSQLSELISKRHLSLRKTRKLVSEIDEGYAVFNSDSMYSASGNSTPHVERILNKSLIALRIAMNRIAENIDDVQDNWLVHEILMQHKNVLHDQIDILLKERRKLSKSRYL
jgi:ParB family transcriptional regulator, chromosome partitioning protein